MYHLILYFDIWYYLGKAIFREEIWNKLTPETIKVLIVEVNFVTDVCPPFLMGQ